jgi:hypothetical protein
MIAKINFSTIKNVGMEDPNRTRIVLDPQKVGTVCNSDKFTRNLFDGIMFTKTKIERFLAVVTSTDEIVVASYQNSLLCPYLSYLQPCNIVVYVIICCDTKNSPCSPVTLFAGPLDQPPAYSSASDHHYQPLISWLEVMVLHDLKNETSFESLLWEEGDRCCHMTCIYADHVRVLVVAKICHLL